MNIEEIVINIKDTKLSLTPDEARELKEILEKLFSKEVTFVPYPYPEPYPVYPYRHPYWSVTTSVNDSGKYTIQSNQSQ